ncbi:MAG: VWA domain-containing protein [Acidobacteria bacterium]|nr:VWA domain-containing protein [Acidobacteriota bacterium]
MKQRHGLLLGGLALLGLAGLLVPPGIGSQGSGRPRLPGEKRFRVDVELVLVPVTVTDPYNRLVTGLSKEHFAVYEDKEPQEILYFSNEDAPISLGLVFDVSDSMNDSGKLERGTKAAVRFLETANPQDEFFLVQFSDTPELLSGFTANVEEIQNQLVYARADGRTALLDALYLALDIMHRGQNPKKALLVISDGGDNRSRYGVKDIKAAVRESDVQIYAIGIFDPVSERERPELVWGPSLLAELAEMTGGRMFPVELYNIHELPDIAAKISIELRNQYVLGYRPTNRQHDGTWRKIKVKLNPPKGLPPLTTYARSGYYAPSQ